MSTRTTTLPSYAYPDRSPSAGSEHDLLASFRSDDDDTITVAIERGERNEDGSYPYYLALSRSGLTEARFTKKELSRVLEVAAALFGSLK
jgi:hypothetical protein